MNYIAFKKYTTQAQPLKISRIVPLECNWSQWGDGSLTRTDLLIDKYKIQGQADSVNDGRIVE